MKKCSKHMNDGSCRLYRMKCNIPHDQENCPGRLYVGYEMIDVNPEDPNSCPDCGYKLEIKRVERELFYYQNGYPHKLFPKDLNYKIKKSNYLWKIPIYIYRSCTNCGLCINEDASRMQQEHYDVDFFGKKKTTITRKTP